jgi:hypothetical protein
MLTLSDCVLDAGILGLSLDRVIAGKKKKEIPQEVHLIMELLCRPTREEAPIPSFNSRQIPIQGKVTWAICCVDASGDGHHSSQEQNSDARKQQTSAFVPISLLH